MKTTRVQFQSLENLAAFMKLSHSSSFTINIQALTVTAPLSTTNVALAVDKFGARLTGK